jgi:hypothetical protein
MTRLEAFWRENRMTIGVIALLAVAFLALRTTPSEIASLEALDAEIARGAPTVLYFYSNT